MMPSRTPQQCRQPGCPETAHPRDGYCPDHLRQQPTHRHNIRSRARDPRYRTPRWAKYSQWRLHQHPMCAICGERAASVTDHIKAVALGGSFWDTRNHQSACKSCHNAKSQAEGVIIDKQTKGLGG